MSEVYNDIMSSLNELLDAAQGKQTGIVIHRRTVKELDTFSPVQIKQIRTSTGLTQKMFAACLGVSVKSIEAWEGGRSHPDGPARRLMGLMRDNPHFIEQMRILV